MLSGQLPFQSNNTVLPMHNPSSRNIPLPPHPEPFSKTQTRLQDHLSSMEFAKLPAL
jgi:hypothetical protein